MSTEGCGDSFEFPKACLLIMAKIEGRSQTKM
jgi:hypothetical protein